MSRPTDFSAVLSGHEPPGRQEITDDLMARLHNPSHVLSEADRNDLIAELVLVNVSVAFRIALRFGGRGCALEDLEQTAYVALIRAVQRFDPTMGHHFLSYVVPCITGEVKKHFRDYGWMVRPPRPVQQLQSLVEQEQCHADPTTGLVPSDHDLAARLDVPLQLVHQARAARGCFTPASLDRPMPGSLDLLLGETLLDDRSEQAYDAAEARAVLEPILCGLSAADRLLLQRRFEDEWTQQEIAVELGVSQSRVSRMIALLLQSLRESINSRDAASSAA